VVVEKNVRVTQRFFDNHYNAALRYALLPKATSNGMAGGFETASHHRKQHVDIA